MQKALKKESEGQKHSRSGDRSQTMQQRAVAIVVIFSAISAGLLLLSGLRTGAFGAMTLAAAVAAGWLLASGRTSETKLAKVDVIDECGREVLNLAAGGICVTDKLGRLLFANTMAAELLGHPADELEGLNLHALLHGSGDGALCAPGADCELAAAETLESSGESRFLHRDGSSFAAEFALKTLAGKGVEARGRVLSFRDISLRKDKEKAKDEFVATMSHELRTPLTSIRGALGLLNGGMLGTVDAKAANLLRIAQTNSDRLAHLLNEILDLERIESGKERLVVQWVEVAEVIRQAVDGIVPLAEEAGVTIENHSSNLTVMADPDRLLQVLTNLLSNAVKFSESGSRVEISVSEETHGMRVTVADLGRGIPADKLESIFGRFQQLEADDARVKGGSGLGLAICRSLVEQHGGRIWAEQNAPRGSRFHIFLPTI